MIIRDIVANNYFRPISRRNRAKGLVPKLRSCSTRFRMAFAVGDERKQDSASKDAWDAMVQLFEILRGEQDDGYLDGSAMAVDTGFIVSNLSVAERQQMLSQGRIDRTRSVPLSLRQTLNKIAHHKGRHTAFRVDGRNAHYLILGGTHQGRHWVAEFLVSKLCNNAAAAIQEIRDY